MQAEPLLAAGWRGAFGVGPRRWKAAYGAVIAGLALAAGASATELLREGRNSVGMDFVRVETTMPRKSVFAPNLMIPLLLALSGSA